MAMHGPDGTQAERRGKRLARGGRTDRITEEVSGVPSAPVGRAPLALHPRVRIMAGSVVGRGGVALMMPVVYTGRALPVAWQGRAGKKGPLPKDRHIALVKQVQPLLPPGASVVWLGAGECAGTPLQHPLQDAPGSSVVRTGSPVPGQWAGERFRGAPIAACRKPGTLVALTEVHVTAAAYGPVRRRCWWANGSPAPLPGRTHLASADAACRWYAKRFRIETCFSAQHSRGFHRPPSHLAAPLRLAHVVRAACVAYLWSMYLGARGAQAG
jgi:hypothetical protein